jgi:hypothetical protein
MGQQSVRLRWKAAQEESLPRLLNLNRKAMLSSRILGTTYQPVSVAHPRWRESSFKLFIKCSESLYCCICIWCVIVLVREDSVKAVWYYKELHKLTVGIIVAGCSYIFISLWNVGYFGSVSWNFQGCPWGIAILHVVLHHTLHICFVCTTVSFYSAYKI